MVLLCLQVIAEKYAIVEMTEPYIPGFLAFREVDHLLGCFKQLEACRTMPQVWRDEIELIDQERWLGVCIHDTCMYVCM